MNLFKTKVVTVDDLLKEIDKAEGKDEIKSVLMKFITGDMASATGVILIWTQQNAVDIDGSHFSEPELVWAFEKAKYKVLGKLISF